MGPSIKNPVYLPRAGFGHNQGLRTALGLCALTGQSLSADELVDEGLRPRLGLGPGNLTAAKAAAEVCGGRLKAELGEPYLDFIPDRPRAGDYFFDMSRLSTRASPVSLILETILLPLAAAGGPGRALLAGGTHVPGGFTSEEMALVLVPNLRKLGLKINYSEISPGFLPTGAGEAELQVNPGHDLRPLVAEEPFKPLEFGVEVTISGLPVHLAEQATESVQARLELHNLRAQSHIRRARGGTGMSLLVWAQGKTMRVGFPALGRQGGRPQALANSAVESLVEFLRSGASLPASLTAFLLAPLARASGTSRLTVDRSTAALKAAVQAVQTIYPGTVRFNQPSQGLPWELTIQGQGWI